MEEADGLEVEYAMYCYQLRCCGCMGMTRRFECTEAGLLGFQIY